MDATLETAASDPIIGITADNRDNTAGSGQYECASAYAQAIGHADGCPVMLPHQLEQVDAYIQMCDGVLLTGGADPQMDHFGVAMHPKARPMDRARQAFELALLAGLEKRPGKAVLGVCLGMQLMAMFHGGKLNQYLPEVLDDALCAAHQGDQLHGLEVCDLDNVLGDLLLGGAVDAKQPKKTQQVVSSHQQAVCDAGSLRVIAFGPGGVIEAVDDPGRPFYVGVQWHPERGSDDKAGTVFNRALLEHFVGMAKQKQK